jgi:S1-C subfamily serine protease
VTPEIADSLALKRPSGVLVAGVASGSPAARAGLRTGDLIVAIDGQSVEDPNAFDYRFATRSLGGEAQLGVVRAGRETRLTVPLETAPEPSSRDFTSIRARSPLQGATVANINPALAEELRIDLNARGVVVVEVADGTPAQVLGLRKGDVVLSVNNSTVQSTNELVRLLERRQRVWRIEINRGGQVMTTVVAG